jgi:demethylmenaquinone methyltransferase/2-methoxy-6-polyprenyl-1,4-benzoquinol methylase
MPDTDRTRGQRVYDRWATYRLPYLLVDRLTRSMRRDAVSELALDPGGTVLDLGCGPGGSGHRLGESVGPDGRVVGLDYSSGMVRRAQRRLDSVPPADVIRADAATLPLATDSVDGVLASLALSAMPRLDRVLDEVARVVRPGGRLVVLDGRTGEGAFGTVLARVYRRLVNVRNPDVLAALHRRFGTVVVTRRFDAGLGFLARVEL